MAKTLEENIISRLDIPNKNDLTTVNVERKFGRAEDYIEIFISNLRGNILEHIPNYTNYKSTTSSEGLTSDINIDPLTILRSRGYTSGTYNLNINIQKRKIFNETGFPFTIHEISSTRTELKLSCLKSNSVLQANSRGFINSVQNSPFFKDFVLSFRNNNNFVGVNIDLDTTTSNRFLVLIKLLKPLPDNYEKGDKLRIAEDIVEPIKITYDLGELEPTDTSTPLRGPNFNIDLRLNETVPTAFKSYNEILTTDTTSSYQRLISRLNNYEIPEIDYGYVRPVNTASLDFEQVTPSHFENFVHFGSATERLKNFEYKLKLVELYNKQFNNINTITGDTSQSAAVLQATASIASKKKKLIESFDGYERFLYFTSGSPYTWPKTNKGEPYLLYHTTSSEAKTWLGSNNSYDTTNYGGQLLSASVFDNQNPNRLIKLVPSHIGDKEENEPYMLFNDMMGNMFDPIWAHIKEISEIRNNKQKYGISKNLVYYALKSLGIESFDQFENEDLINYVFGAPYTTSDTTTVITASLNTSSKEDITKEVWKRLYNNAPYLLKTKGTERGLRALINCYGIPDTMLDIKEYGSADPNRDEFKTYSYSKFSKVLSGYSENHDGFFLQTDWNSTLTSNLSASAKTVEFRIKPGRLLDKNGIGAKQHLFSLSGSVSASDLHLLLSPNTSTTDVYTDGDAFKFGHLELQQFTSSIATSSLFPIFNGNFWNIFIGTDGASGNDATVRFGAYQANHLQEIMHYTSSVTLSERRNAEAFGNPNFRPNLVTNGTFDTDSNFTKNTGWTISDGVASYNNLGTHNDITQTNLEIEEGKSYEISFDLFNVHQGNFGISLGNSGFDFIPSSSNGGPIAPCVNQYGNHVTHTMVAGGGLLSGTLKLRATAAFSGSIDNLKVKPLHPEHHNGATRAFFGGIRNFGTPATSSNYTTANTGSAFDLEYSGSMSEVRYYFGEMLNHKTLSNHALEPLMYSGNSISSSYNHLVLRYPLSFELDLNHDTTSQIPSASTAWNITPTDAGLISPSSPLTGIITGGAILSSSLDINQSGGEPIFTIAGIPLLQSHHPNEDTSYLNGFSFMTGKNVLPFVEEHHLPTPNTIGRSPMNRKIRVDEGKVEDNILSPLILSQESTAERQVPDFDSLGVFFSPQNEISEDIIYTLGTFSLDEKLGDPRHASSSYYPDLKQLQDIYFNKLEKGSKKQNIFDFVRTVQFTDHTLFSMIRQFAPQKASLKTGLLIEPHYLERTKFSRYNPITKNVVSLKANLSEVTQSFHKNNNISSLNLSSGSAIISTNSNIARSKAILKENFDNGDFGFIPASNYTPKDELFSLFLGGEGTEIIRNPSIASTTPSSTGNTASPVNDISDFPGFIHQNTLINGVSPGVFSKIPNGFRFDVLTQPTNPWHIRFTQQLTDASGNPSGANGFPALNKSIQVGKFYKLSFEVRTNDTTTQAGASGLGVIRKGNGTDENVRPILSGNAIQTRAHDNTILNATTFTKIESTFECQFNVSQQLQFYLNGPQANEFLEIRNISLVEVPSTGFSKSGGNNNILTLDNPHVNINESKDLRIVNNQSGNSNMGAVSEPITLVNGKKYKVSFNVKVNAGSLRYKIANRKQDFNGTHLNGGQGADFGYVNRDGSPFTTTNAGTNFFFENVFTVNQETKPMFITFFGANGLDAQVDNLLVEELNDNNRYFEADNGRPLQIGFNSTILVDKLIKGKHAWEQGPLIPNSTGSVKQRNSSGSNKLRPWTLTPYGNYTNSRLSTIAFRSSSSYNVEFDDSLIDLSGWKNSRHAGSRLTGAKINEYTAGDTTYGLNPVINQNSSAIYFGKSIIGADGEDDGLVTIKNHSYIDIEKIMLIDKHTDRITEIDVKNENYKGINAYLAKDFKDGSSFNIEILDPKITHQLKNNHKAKFSQGYLRKVIEHKGSNGTGNISGQGIQVGYVDVSTAPFPYTQTNTSQSIFCYGRANNTMNSDTLVLKSNTLTKKIWPIEQSFGLVDFVTSSNNYVYSTMQNLGSFINSMLIPVASESNFRLFGTFNLGQPLNVADYSLGSDAGIKNISTVEFNIASKTNNLSGSYVVSSSLHSRISASSDMQGFGKELLHPDHYVIPIMQGPHDHIKTKKAGANINWPGNGSNTGASRNSGATNIQLRYYFSGDAPFNAIYQISYLEEKQVIIADIDKPTELGNDVGDEGYVLIPGNIDKDIRDNLSFYLDKAGLKEAPSAKKLPLRKN